MEPESKIPPSLGKICVGNILQNIGSYKKSLKTKLAPPAREMLLEELTKNAKRIKGLEDGFAFDKVWADLPFLLNSRTKEFTSRWLRDMLVYSVPPQPLQPIIRELLVHLSEQAPNLEQLELYFSLDDTPIYLDKQELLSIGRMEKLTKIHVFRVTIKLADFCSLTIKCKNLREITAWQVDIDEEPTFTFERFPVQEITVSISQVKCIGIHLRNDSSDGAISTGYRLLYLEPRKISRLSIMEKLTNMTRFDLNCALLEDEDTLEEFPYLLPSLDSAEIYESSGNVLRKFLEKNGEKLDKLRIFGLQREDATLSYAQVFDWCPNLKHLNVTASHLFGNEIRIQCLEHLQCFEFNDEFQYEGQPVLQLSCILSAPNLQVVKISVFEFDLGDYQSFIARITNREIFKNLKFLSLDDDYRYANYDESNDINVVDFDGRQRLEELEDAIKLSRLTHC